MIPLGSIGLSIHYRINYLVNLIKSYSAYIGMNRPGKTALHCKDVFQTFTSLKFTNLSSVHSLKS